MIEEIKKILIGIDQTELGNPEGWGETSAGAEFGANKLKQIAEALAQSEQEPVAWMYDWIAYGEEGETVIRDWISANYDESHSPTAGCHNIRPLYTTPPNSKPLSDEEIDAIYTGVRAVHHEIDSYVFARAIEAAHGIKE